MLTQAVKVTMLSFLLGFAQIDAQQLPEGIMPKRQVAGTGVTPSTTPPVQSTTPPPTTSSSTVQQQSSSNDDSSSQQQSSQQSSQQSQQQSTTIVHSTSVPTTVKVTSTNSDGSKVTSEISTGTLQKSTETKKNSFVSLKSTTLNAATLTHKTVVSTPLVTKHTEKSVYTSFWTSDGHVYSDVITSNVVVASTTGFAKTTISPSLADGGGSGSNLSSNTKAVIGGVVGGIGGAILIGGLAFVAWRLWGKKKQQAANDDYDYSWAKENRQSNITLGSEPYSNPGGRVNTASNF